MELFLKFISLIGVSITIMSCMSLKAGSSSDQMQIDKLIDRGVLLMRDADLDGAEASFKVALEIGHSSAALDGLGCVAFLRGDLNTAEELFWRAYEVDATYNTSLGNLALLYEVRGDSLKAAEFYKRAIAEDPQNYRSRNNYAVFLNEQRRSESTGRGEARAELLKAISLSLHPTIESNLGVLKE